MSFASIVVPSGTYAERARGTYVLSTLAFGGPANEIRLRANSSAKAPNFTITRYRQIDVTEGTITRRVAAVVTCQVSLPPGISFTGAQVDEMITDIATFADSSTLTRMLQGEA